MGMVKGSKQGMMGFMVPGPNVEPQGRPPTPDGSRYLGRMRLQVHYFAALRDQKGRREETVELPEGTTARQAYERLCLSPALPVAFAVNQQYVDGATVLEDGDELALLPPLGGG
jgi:molybdopterin converting factor small subunit